MSLILSVLLLLVFSAIVIFIVSKLGLGLEVDGFVTALIAAAVIAIVSGIVYWLLGLLGIAPGGGWFGALISLVIAAVVLMVSGSFLKGLRVNGFVGALIAAVAIGVVTWLIEWVLSLFM